MLTLPTFRMPPPPAAHTIARDRNVGNFRIAARFIIKAAVEVTRERRTT